MKSSTPVVSVVIPAFNAEKYLDQCLVSIEHQEYEHLEIICINDGSTDNSLSVMKKHQMVDGRIKIINKENQGYGATCNRGIEEAQGEYVSIIEPDDWISGEMYRDMIAFAQSLKEDIDIIKTPYWRIWMPDTSGQRTIHCSYQGRVKPPKQPFTIADAAHLLTHHPSIWSALYKKDFLDRYEIRFREFPGAGWADNPFLIETFCQARSIAFLDVPYYCYREETPEKSRDFVLRSTLLPIDRWNDMMDELERLDVRDERVIRAHNSRGFTYLSGIIEVIGFSRDDVREAAVNMFSRMDAELVFSDKKISPGCKRLYANLMNLPQPKSDNVSYIASLLSDGFYNLRNTGLKNTMYATKNYFVKRKLRIGE